MISISHVQARRLIHAQLDERKLPEEQWTALHAHLESCPDCRAFQERLAAAERSLRRVLHQYWDPVGGPREETPALLAALYRERRSIRRMGRWMLGGAAAFLLSVMLFVGWSAGVLPGNFSRVLAVPAPSRTPIPLTPAPSPTPTRAPAVYQGVIAYEYRPGNAGAGEIYLLNAGSEPVNLTNNPADDHAPAWSPDGEWLAFLSNRTGKDEVYVMHVSGTRLTQLTDLPNVTWRGSISWRSDGQMLAIIGERKMGETSKTWVYLVPLDGSNAYPLGMSEGAVQAAFSPNPDQRMLAFSSLDDWDGQLVIYNFDSERTTFITDSWSLAGISGPTGSVDLIDWSVDGKEILYRASMAGMQTSSLGNIDREELRAATVSGSALDPTLSSRHVTYDITVASIPALSWTGIKDEFAYLVDTEEGQASAPAGCKMIRLGAMITASARLNQDKVSGLCVDEGLERANWRLKDKSVLVIGRELATTGSEGSAAGRDGATTTGERGLYIVRFLASGTRIEWLADATRIAGPPLLRPSAAALAIDPKPVQTAAALPSSPLPGPEVGDLLVISMLGDRTLIDRLSPGSSHRTTINQSVGENDCPVWSPDHARIAFLSDRSSAQPQVNHVFVMDGSGLHARLLTQQRFRFEYRVTTGNLDPPGYSCPVWSPDGRWLASTVNLPGLQENAVAIPTNEKDGLPSYLPAIPGMKIDLVSWLPDGRLLVAFSKPSPAQIILRAYNPATIQDGKESEYVELLSSTDWSYVAGIAASPDGKSLALAVTRDEQNSVPTFGLLIAAFGSSPASQSGSRPGALDFHLRYQVQGILDMINTDSLRWLPGGRLGYTLHYPAGQKVKVDVFTIASDGSGAPERIASFTDELLATAWSPDGRWLTATTVTGRYVLDTSLAPTVVPARVDGEQGSLLSW